MINGEEEEKVVGRFYVATKTVLNYKKNKRKKCEKVFCCFIAFQEWKFTKCIKVSMIIMSIQV